MTTKHRLSMLLMLPMLAVSLFSFTRPSARLQTGDRAPIVSIQDIDGENLQFSTNQKTYLVFFRFTGCPICNIRVHELAAAHKELQAKGYEPIIVFESTAEALQQYRKDTGLPFRMISDPEGTLYRAYGVKKSVWTVINTVGNKEAKSRMQEGKALYDGKEYKSDGSMTRRTAEFVIGQNGRIEIAHYGKNLADHLDLSSF
ncbi:MAG: peroxiredoxin-like family protein [Bacteroidota bacterium]